MLAFGISLIALAGSGIAPAPLHALPRDPAVSRTHIAFVEAGQLWVMPRSGGSAVRVSNLPGRKFTPRFSPDGTKIAFSSNEAQGEVNLFTVSLEGGAASRLTFIPSHQRLTQWTRDGKLLFHTNSLSFSPIEMQLFTVPSAGGLVTPLPVAYGSDGAIDDTGEWLAYTPQWQTSLIEYWKEYRGGFAPDLWLVNLRTGESRRITEWEGSDLHPMWHGTTLYYLSDAGPEKNLNLWAYERNGGARRQVTHFRDFDARNASIGPDAIVFELGQDLHLLDLATEKSSPLRTEIPAREAPSLRPEVDAGAFVTYREIVQGGKQVFLEARGDLWLAGTSESSQPRNLTATSGAFEREASVSPDGRSIAYWSDATGEYQLYVRSTAGSRAAGPLTRFTGGFRFRPAWSPDSRRLAYVDQWGVITVFDVTRRRLTRADADPWEGDPVQLAWSPDSKWLAYTRTGSNRLTAIWRFEVASGRRQQLTADAYNASNPAFDPRGDHFFFVSNRDFSRPNYDWLQKRIAYTGTNTLMAVPLAGMVFDIAHFEGRAARLSTTAGSITALGVTQEGDPIYALTESQGTSSVRKFDLRKQKELPVPDAASIVLSPNGRYLLVEREGKTLVREIADSTETVVHTKDMTVTIDLRAEWRQIFTDTWRLYRDFFYAPKVGLEDWDAVRKRYAGMIERCLSRAEVNLVQAQMIGECGVGHAYLGAGGDVGAQPPPSTVGMPGADFVLENGGFRISRVPEGAPWEDRARSPLREAQVGDYLLAVNGKPVDTGNDPRAAFVGLAGKPVPVTIGSHPTIDSSSREITITPLSNEFDLRRRAWVEENRKVVDRESGGRIGYLHIPDFGINGYNELEQQFTGQIDKEALILDARWSNGGWTGTIICELMDRPPLAFHASRERKEVWPDVRWGGHFGPKAVLVNHVTVSAGESFSYFFRRRGIGPLVGSRTWGGSTALNPVPALLDGGYVNVPNAPFYNETGWLFEGHGLDPDVAVEPDPARMWTEGDAQLAAAVKTLSEALNTKTFRPPALPAGRKSH